MKEQIAKIKENALAEISNSKTLQELENVRVKYLGKKGELTAVLKGMKDLSPEERPVIGSIVNEVRDNLESKIKEVEEILKEKAMNLKLEKERIDITLPATKIKRGSKHPINRIIEEVEDIFVSMGYDVVSGPELETDEYCFERLNLPKGHPARDAQDTFYLKGDEILLRSQTSPVQIRTMLEAKGEKPVRMICPGKTYRRDDDDATHSHQFMQIEGLLVDKNIHLTDLKGTFEIVAKRLFGSDTEVRLKPSYYQFTEPSVELDISCFNCKGKGCAICKNSGYITVAGAGMVHPNVLRNCGYDPAVWSGFAFGFGAERLAMLKYGITDIRTFYMTDLRCSKTFDRKEDNND